METPGLFSPSKSAEDESELNLTEKLALSESDSEESPRVQSLATPIDVPVATPDTGAEFVKYGENEFPDKLCIDSDDYSSPEKSRATSKKKVNQLVDSEDSDQGTAIAKPSEGNAALNRLASLIDDDDSDDDVLPSRLVVSGSEGDDDAEKKRPEKSVPKRKLITSESSDAEPYQRSSSENEDSKIQPKKVKKLTKKSQKKKTAVLSEGSEIQNRLTGLCDESSEDEDYKAPEDTNNEDTPTLKSAAERPPKRLTAKDAEEQMKLIQSESQRMAREASLSVPYHRPKQHSLKEFLNRHNVIRPVAQMDAPKAAAAIKMSKEQLEEYAKGLDERAKESQAFFKSESEETEDDEVADKHIENELPSIVTVPELPTPTEPVAEALNANEDKVEASVTDSVSVESEELPKSLDSPAVEITSEPISPQPNPDPTPTAPPIPIDYNFEEEAPKPVSKLDLLKERVRAQLTPNSSPSLKGSFDTIIDLDTGDVLPGKNAGREELFQRFLKHKAKPAKKASQDISLLSTENGVVHIESVVMQPEETDEVIQDSKPRSAFFKLKEALGTKLAQKRREEIMRRKADAEFLEKKNKVGAEDEEELDDDFEEESDNEGEETNNEDTPAEAPEVLEIDEDEELVTADKSNDEENMENEEEDDGKEDEDDVDNGDADDDGNSDENGDESTSKERRRIVMLPDSDEEDAQAISNTQLQKTTREVDDLLDICSDTQVPVVRETPKTATPTSGLFTQSVDNEDVSESQLVGLCSGAFFTQAPVAEDDSLDKTEPSALTASVAFASSDEEDSERVDVLPTKKLTKKRAAVQLSDDDEEAENETKEDVEDEEDEAVEDDAEVLIDYDSEENEIEVVQTKTDRRKRANEFLEKEAELSESEWGSEDEDEKNMDRFDAELGDADVFDEAQVQSELERIHMRRMRDADAREVKIIKDMLIEDEEDTGAGRERQFRWKNVNDTNWDDAPAADGEVVLRESDDENEEAWRKMRHERELLLKDSDRSVTAADAIEAQQNTTAAPSPLRLSTTLNSTATTTRRRINIVKTSANTPPVNAKTDSPFLIGKASGALQSTRNSFLGRDEETLARLAALSKPEVEGGALSVVSKGGGNFVFSTLSPTVAAEKKGADKRKSEPAEDSAQAAKKPKSGADNMSKGLMKKRLLDSLT